MSIMYMNAVWGSTIGPVNKRMVLLALADNANDRGLCIPGAAHLVGKCGVARSTLFRILADLEAEGLLQRAPRRRQNGSRQTNVYRLNYGAIISRRRLIGRDEIDELEALFDLETADEEDGEGPEEAPDDTETAEDESAAQGHGPGAGPCAGGGGDIVPERDHDVVPERDHDVVPERDPLNHEPSEPPSGYAPRVGHAPLRSAAAADMPPLRSGTSLPSKTGDDFTTGPFPDSICELNHLNAGARGKAIADSRDLLNGSENLNG